MGRYVEGAGDDAAAATKWWSDYPTSKYTTLARAQDCFSSIVSDVWSRPKRLGRSASFTNLTYVREAQHDFPALKRTSSYSSLAPSLTLSPQYDRVAERIVHTAPVYRPFISDWYNKAYNVARFKDTHRELERPLRREVPPYEHFTHVPFYSLQTKRIFFEERARPYKSYLRGSQDYLNRYTSARLRADDFAQQYAYTAYEWRKPQDYSFNRHMVFGSSVYVPHAPGNPHSYTSARPIRNLYRTSGRLF